MTDLFRFNAGQMRDGFLSGAFSPVEVLESVARRIESVEPVVESFTTLALDQAREKAAAAETAYARREARPLEGIPFGVKDIFDTGGLRTTYGSSMFIDHVPTEDAVVVRRLTDAGAIVVGKTVTHEFAWGITSVNPHVGSPHNPWSPDRIAGGSSGGSASAVAGFEVPFALGTDTGGSIRIPASFCGVAGLKPTFGAVSAAGVFPLAPSLDHPGFMARDPSDIIDLLRLTGGFDDSDPATIDAIKPFSEATRESAKGLRVGLCADLNPVRLQPGVEQALAAAANRLAALGADVVEVGFPEASIIEEAFATTQRGEAYQTHHRKGLYPARAQEYGADVQARLEAAAGIDLHQYLEAARLRGRVRSAFHRLFTGIDVLLTAISPITAPVEGVDEIEHFGTVLPLRSLVMPFVVPHNLAGLPSIAIRAGFDARGLPVGVQLSGPPGSDYSVIVIAKMLSAATAPVQDRWPEIAAAAT